MFRKDHPLRWSICLLVSSMICCTFAASIETATTKDSSVYDSGISGINCTEIADADVCATFETFIVAHTIGTSVQIPINRHQWLDFYAVKTRAYNRTYYNVYHRAPPTQLDRKPINSMAITTPVRIQADFGRNPNGQDIWSATRYQVYNYRYNNGNPQFSNCRNVFICVALDNISRPLHLAAICNVRPAAGQECDRRDRPDCIPIRIDLDDETKNLYKFSLIS